MVLFESENTASLLSELKDLILLTVWFVKASKYYRNSTELKLTLVNLA